MKGEIQMGVRERGRLSFLVALVAVALIAAACGDDGGEEASPTPGGGTTGGETTGPAAEPLTFGMILVGPQNDHGWSQAHFEAGQYLEQKLGAKMIVTRQGEPGRSARDERRAGRHAT